MKNLILLIAWLAFFLACRNNSQPVNQQDTTGENKVGISQQEAEETHQASPVTLNNGEKWTANPETKAGIKNMIALVSAFPETVGVDEYSSLKMKLETEFSQILEKCTMTGEAHTQLHNYLLPMREMILSLNSQDVETLKEGLNKLKQHLNEFGNYFV